MKVNVPLIVQDPTTSESKRMAMVEGFNITREPFFLDGPVTKRVAVLDFDPTTGQIRPGARFLPPKPGNVVGRYECPRPEIEAEAFDPRFMQVSVFGTVLRTMYMFEEPDTLGRELTWAFGAPQILVIPQAGDWANAFYERDSHSLQFFSFQVPGRPDARVYTCLSRDIVAHETGHAILDGIAPDLYDAVTPQSLAVHEAIADLTALMMAFRSHTLRKTLLDQTRGSIKGSNAFSSVAEEFGKALGQGGYLGYLRNLLNDKTLDPDGGANLVRRDEPHALSEVLSGALYTMMVNMHEQLKTELAEKTGESRFAVSGRALGIGSERFKRIVFRALDYLPPGEISFADYGRAIIAADQASHPDAPAEREWIKDEFVRRHMVPSREALEVETGYRCPALDDVDLDALVESDWVAYDFANRNRALLHIPESVPFHVRPRLVASKRYYHQEGAKTVQECLFKVAWDVPEENAIGRRFPSQRQITVGTTLAIDWLTRKVRALLTSDQAQRPEEAAIQREDRNAMLRYMLDHDVLEVGAYALGPSGRPRRSVVRAEAARGTLRVRGAARLLEIAVAQ